MQEKIWKIKEQFEVEARNLHNSLGISLPLCTLLCQRGISSYDEAFGYFRPALSAVHNPWIMRDMDKAVERILLAIQNNEKVMVFGDYDVDGTTSVAMMYGFLQTHTSLGDCIYYIPDRYKEGYGVSKAGIDYAYENGFSLIVALDCGIKSVELVSYASTLKIDFIICDHHLPGTTLPAAAAILNPKQKDCTYPYKELCGCGVGYKLICAVAEKLNLSTEIPQSYLDLVATAIAADIVPMTGENRILAYYGLKKINENPSPGFTALLTLAGAVTPIHITNLVFIVAPRINAAGRMDDAKKAVQLFISTTAEEAALHAEALHVDNTSRKEADSSITEEALDMLAQDENAPAKRSTVLYRPHWHKGVVGIVASRVIEKYYKPTIILTKHDAVLTGSARSVGGFNLYEAIYECRDLLLQYGGHFAAAGLSLKPENLEAFTIQFETAVASKIEPDSLVPTLSIDAELHFSEINFSLYNIICQMEPFGPLNLRPQFISRAVTDAGYSKIVKEDHIRLVAKQNDVTITGIGFNMVEKFPIVSSGKPFDVVYTIDENIWNGNKSLQLKIIDIRMSESL